MSGTMHRPRDCYPRQVSWATERAGGVRHQPTSGHAPQMKPGFLKQTRFNLIRTHDMAEQNLRERVRVGEIERGPLSEGLDMPNSMGTPSGMPAPTSSPFGVPPLERLPFPLIPDELVCRPGVVTRTGSGIIESMPPAAESAASLSNDELLRALIWCGVDTGANGSAMGDRGMGSDDGDITGEKGERCWGVVARGINEARFELEPFRLSV
jgi:hypothetical protein